MSRFDVRLNAEPAEYRPGAVLEGEARWHLDGPLESLDLNVYWTTDGNFGAGIAPMIVHSQKIAVSALEGRHLFRLDLPQGPWSFQGKLFSVRWYVELSEDEQPRERAEFILGPEGRPVGPGSDAPA